MQRLRTTTPRLTMHGYGVGFQTRLYIAPSVSLPGLSFTAPSVAMPSCITSSGKVGTATSKMICGYAVPQAAQLQVAQRTSRTLSFPVQTSFRLLTGSSTLGQPWQVWTDHPLSLLPLFSPTTSMPGQRTSGLQAQLTDCGPGYGSTSWGPSGGSGVPGARPGVSVGGSRVLVLQRGNRPLA
jgi:hypothetical protein